MEFRSEKIPRNRLGTISVIPRKKVLIPRHSEFRGRASSEARNGTERNGIPRKIEVLRNWWPHPCKGCMITTTLRYSKMISPYLKSRLFWHYFWNFGLLRFVLRRILFRRMVRNGIPTVCFYIFSRNGIPSCFLFRRRIRKGILRVCLYLMIIIIINLYFSSDHRKSNIHTMASRLH